MKKIIFILLILVLFTWQLYARVQDPSPPSMIAESKLKPTGEIPRDWPHPIKWDQMVGIDSYSGASFICNDELADALTADDFECTETGWITDIHFAGYSHYGNQWINQFRVTIWSDFPAIPDDESHPDLLLWEVYVNQADPADTLGIGWTDLNDGTFRINLPESEWFYQEGTDTAPIIYWIGIQGVMVDDGFADYFYWNFRDRYISTWNDDAAFYSNSYGFPPWYNWGWESHAGDLIELYDGPFPTGWDSSADMAFRLSGIEEDSETKWEQLPDLSPTGMDVYATWQPEDPQNPPIILADDFLCTETGYITDIHIWGSWKNDYFPFYEDPAAVQFTFSIHSDIPAGPTHSMPGEVLWMKTWIPAGGDVEWIEYGLEDWYNPNTGEWIDDNHFLCFKYNYILDPADYFLQEGTPEVPIIYWLDVQAVPMDPAPACRFGWKTSLDHWNDDAVWTIGNEPYFGPWQELRYPIGHEYEYQSIDLAFVITTEEEPEELDFGDAPDPTYPTLLANIGASHIIDGVTYMGALIDAEPDGLQSLDALGDDWNNLDDEDGVTFTSILVQGYTTYVTVNASVDGVLNAWVDFNINGDWADAGEQIFTDVSLTAGDNYLSFNVPTTAVTDTTFARFRFDTAGGLTFSGLAPNGEVEDYQVVIHEPIEDSKMHFPQWPDPSGWDVHCTEPNIIADDWGCIASGPVTDIHFWVSWFTGDGYYGYIDSIHISIHDNIPATPYSMPGTLLWERDFKPGEFTYEEYGQGLQGWYDPWPPMYIPNDHEYFDLINITNIPDPFYQQEGTIYWLDVRIFIDPQYSSYQLGWKTSQHHWEDQAVYFNGSSWDPLYDPITEEPLDMAFVITGSEQPDSLDFGDAPDPTYQTLIASGGARHVIDYVTFLGALIDAENDGWQSINALGDDNHDLADEDGVIFKQIMTGSPAQVIVTTSVPGYLQGWMDFNADGDWIDTNEQIFTDSYIHFASTVCLNYYVPATADTGYTFARFRFSTNPGLADSGLAQDGEVEDYMVHIGDSSNVKWSQLPCEELPGLHSHDYSPPYQEVVHADDWLCNGGLVTDIHWWGNYEVDASGAEIRGSGINQFHLSIHNNNPTGGCIPLDPEIWGVDVPFASVNETDTGLLNSEGCKIYLYEYYLDIPFEQIEDEYYWLDICAYSNDPADYAIWRWQESARRYTPILYGAAEKLLPTPGTWLTVQWGSTPPYRYSDMAFEITSEPYVPELDFGDAPDPTYPTLLASNGARHALDGVTYLGNQIDAENDGWQSITALGDDNHNLDDEDGVTFTCPLIPGEQGAITVITNSAGVAFFNSWIDFNADGDWSDAGEHLLIDQGLLAGPHYFYFNIPAGATIDSTYARFRISTFPGLADTGYAPDGEVEDYRIKISVVPDDDCKMHFHQWPDTTSFGVDVCVTQDYEMTRIVADDFLCMETGPINSIHIWGSWLNDFPPGPPTYASFQLGIWSDNPSGPNVWSEPAILLWERPFFPGEYVEEPCYYVPDGECWYDPCTGYLQFPGDFVVWKYDFTIPNEVAFTQEEGNIYWLSVTAFPEIPDTQFGWKSSVNHWNDDAVYQCMFPFDPWTEMIYPYGHPFNLSGEEHVSMDMAFYINCEPSTPIVSISVSSDTVYVSWDPIPCADSYTVYSSIDPYAAFPSAWTVEQTGITSTSWCENVSGTTKKFYRVVAIK